MIPKQAWLCDERLGALKQIWEQANKSRQKENVPALASDRNMEYCDPQICTQFLKGNWSMKPIKSISDSQVQYNLLNWAPLGTTAPIRARDEIATAQAQSEDANGDKECLILIIHEYLTCFGQLKSLLANWVGDSDACLYQWYQIIIT